MLLLTKYTPASVIGQICPLQSSTFPRLCIRSSISATAGPGFLETYTEWSVIVPEFQ